jgi:hypothetical protein
VPLVLALVIARLTLAAVHLVGSHSAGAVALVMVVYQCIASYQGGHIPVNQCTRSIRADTIV